MRKLFGLIMLAISMDIHAEQSVLLYCSTNLFPSGNIERVIVETNATGIAVYQRGQATSLDHGYFSYSRTNGVVKFNRLRQVEMNLATIQEATTFQSLMGLHFGPGAETNPAITEAVVSGYFIQRRLDGTADPTDASDALILRSLYDRMRNMTIDGTTWSFPWGDLP